MELTFSTKGGTITKAVINWHLEDKKETETVVLDEKTESEVKEMNHDDASAPGIFYTVKFASEYSGPIKTPEIKTSERAILVGLDQLEGKKFVNIETGTLDEAASVLVSILPEGKDGDSTESRQISKDNPNPKQRTIEDIVLMAITADDELCATTAGAVAAIKADSQYPPLFRKAFGTEEITMERIQKAIAQYVRS